MQTSIAEKREKAFLHVKYGDKYAKTAERWLWLLHRNILRNGPDAFGVVSSCLAARIGAALDHAVRLGRAS